VTSLCSDSRPRSSPSSSPSRPSPSHSFYPNRLNSLLPHPPLSSSLQEEVSEQRSPSLEPQQIPPKPIFESSLARASPSTTSPSSPSRLRRRGRQYTCLRSPLGSSQPSSPSPSASKPLLTPLSSPFSSHPASPVSPASKPPSRSFLPTRPARSTTLWASPFFPPSPSSPSCVFLAYLSTVTIPPYLTAAYGYSFTTMHTPPIRDGQIQADRYTLHTQRHAPSRFAPSDVPYSRWCCKGVEV
jgi:hypothetical protein